MWKAPNVNVTENKNINTVSAQVLGFGIVRIKKKKNLYKKYQERYNLK